MNKKCSFVALFLMILSSISLNGQTKDSTAIEKYRVYTDVINQIQRKGNENKDTIDYFPVIINRKTVYKTDSNGFMLHNKQLSNSLFSDSISIELLPFLNIENKKLIGYDTIFINLQCMLDSLSSKSRRLSNNFYFKTKAILSRKWIEALKISKGDYWATFYHKYPHSFGKFEVSDVCFSKDMKYAIVYVGFQSRGLVDNGTIYLLKKEMMKWQIVKERCIWIS